MDNNLGQLTHCEHGVIGEALVIARLDHHLATEVVVLIQPGSTGAMHLDRAQVVVLHALPDEGVHVISSRVQLDFVSFVVAVLEHGDMALLLLAVSPTPIPAEPVRLPLCTFLHRILL